MIRIRKQLIILLMFTAALVMSYDAPAFAANGVSFKGHFSGVLSPPHGPPPEVLSGSGNASHLGRSTNSGYGVITGSAKCEGGFAARNDETLTSANGDQITLTIYDEDCPIAPGVFKAVGTFVVTGGTGRFTGASGKGNLTGSPDFNKGTFEFSFDGTISRPKGG